MWLDKVSAKIANWIVLEAIPAVKAFFNEYFSNTIFHTMTTEELQIYFLKIAIQAIILILILGIRPKKSKKSSKKIVNRKPKTAKSGPKQKWTPTGWYWNEKEGLWEPPDYIVKESHERWRYDKVRGIWIDLNEEKE